MKTWMAMVAIGFIGVVTIPAGEPDKKPAQTPTPNFDGVWKVVSVKFGMLKKEESEVPVDGALIERIVVFRGMSVAMPVAPFIMSEVPSNRMWRIRVDATKLPKKLDLLDVVEMDDNAKGTGPLKCVYAFEKDKLTVRFHYAIGRLIFAPFFWPKAPRPKSFDFADSDVPSATVTFQRISK